jgi:hypothetical protein
MNAASEKRLKVIHPALSDAVRRMLGTLERRGLVVEVVQGLRTFAEQDALYAQGRTRPGAIVTRARGGESNHNFGLAVDLCPFVEGRPDWNAPIQTWALIGEVAAAQGLEWGGAWAKFLDKPHVQLPSMSVKECQRLHASGGLDAVWAEATERLAAPRAPSRGRAAAPRRRELASRGVEADAARTAGPGKRVTVILYGADRNLWRGGPVQIRVSDVFAAGGPRVLYDGRGDGSTLDLRLELPFDSGQVYGLTFSAAGHRPAWQLVRRADFIRAGNVERDDLILRLMVVPDDPGSSDLAAGHERLRQLASPLTAAGTGIDADTYDGLSDAAKMAFLNVEAKLRESAIDGLPLISFVRGVQHVATDRVFLQFDAALKARMPRCADFANAPGHPAPKSLPSVPAHPDSWKHTKFAEGNVQLSFSAAASPFPGGSEVLCHSADVDIDLGRGLAHAAEWLDNNVFRPGHKTDQTLVYGLLYAQNILPHYTLDPVPTTTERGGVLLRRVTGRAENRRAEARPRKRPAPKTRSKNTRKRSK